MFNAIQPWKVRRDGSITRRCSLKFLFPAMILAALRGAGGASRAYSQWAPVKPAIVAGGKDSARSDALPTLKLPSRHGTFTAYELCPADRFA